MLCLPPLLVLLHLQRSMAVVLKLATWSSKEVGGLQNKRSLLLVGCSNRWLVGTGIQDRELMCYQWHPKVRHWKLYLRLSLKCFEFLRAQSEPALEQHWPVGLRYTQCRLGMVLSLHGARACSCSCSGVGASSPIAGADPSSLWGPGSACIQALPLPRLDHLLDLSSPPHSSLPPSFPLPSRNQMVQEWQASSFYQCCWADGAAYISPAAAVLVRKCFTALPQQCGAEASGLRCLEGSLGLCP